MPTLVMMRHGESAWNRANRFTGWTDVDLTDAGIAEAHRAGQLLRDKGYRFDRAFTSVLKRAIRTLNVALDELDQAWIPVEKHWRLNERHYGALQGLNKAETAARFGDAQVLIWRRAYAIAPDPLPDGDARHPREDARYAGIDPALLPATECLQDTVVRVLPYWNERIAPALAAGETVLIAAHGNSLRALVKYLDGMGDDAIVNLNIPTAQPLVYELDAALKPLRHFYLADPEEIARAQAAVAAQGKAQA
jgi:2,3-bisphosphoglycerate-dependent phosphoglycerate mutase